MGLAVDPELAPKRFAQHPNVSTEAERSDVTSPDGVSNRMLAVAGECGGVIDGDRLVSVEAIACRVSRRDNAVSCHLTWLLSLSARLLAFAIVS
jgi:hypothetical protein